MLGFAHSVSTVVVLLPSPLLPVRVRRKCSVGSSVCGLFGMALFVDPQAHPADREPLSEKEEAQGIPFQTLGYRAPEVLLGSSAYGKPADIFSLGVTLAQMAGDASLQGVTGKKMGQFEYAMMLLRKSGVPGSTPLDWRPFKASYPK